MIVPLNQAQLALEVLSKAGCTTISSVPSDHGYGTDLDENFTSIEVIFCPKDFSPLTALKEAGVEVF